MKKIKTLKRPPKIIITEEPFDNTKCRKLDDEYTFEIAEKGYTRLDNIPQKEPQSIKAIYKNIFDELRLILCGWLLRLILSIAPNNEARNKLINMICDFSFYQIQEGIKEGYIVKKGKYIIKKK